MGLKLGACHSLTGNFLEKGARCQSRKQFVPLCDRRDERAAYEKRAGTWASEIIPGLGGYEDLRMKPLIRSPFVATLPRHNLFPDISIATRTHTHTHIFRRLIWIFRMLPNLSRNAHFSKPYTRKK